MDKQQVITEDTHVPLKAVAVALAAIFSVVVFVSGALYWGGLLQARAESLSDRLNKVEYAIDRFAVDQTALKGELVEIKFLLQQKENAKKGD